MNQEEERLQKLSGCEVVKIVKYLGFYVMGENVELLKNIYERLWDKIKVDLQVWNKFNLSLMGRIAVLKMNVLPKLLFLFQAILVITKMKILEQWQGVLTNFVWHGRKARINRKSVCLERKLRVVNA